MFDLAKRFALLESRAGPATVRIARVVAEGSSAPCPRCEWRVLLTDPACENCGLENARAADATDSFGLPPAVVSIRFDRFSAESNVARGRESTHAISTPMFSRDAEWTGREAWRCGPKSFRRRVDALVATLGEEAGIDVLCTATARPRWLRLARQRPHPFRVLTPRRLVTHEWTDDVRLLVIDTPSAFDPTTRTFQRLALAPHRFVVARASERRIAEPDCVFALTDLVAPGTFASVVETRTLHRLDRAAFVVRRDSVIVRSTEGSTGHVDVPADDHAASSTPPRLRTATWRKALLVAIGRTGTRLAREVVTLAISVNGEYSLHAASMFWTLAADAPLDRSHAPLADGAFHDLFAAETARNARTLAASLARIARAYAERIDLAPRSARAALADEFARRAEALAAHGTLRICVDVLASVTLSASSRP